MVGIELFSKELPVPFFLSRKVGSSMAAALVDDPNQRLVGIGHCGERERGWERSWSEGGGGSGCTHPPPWGRDGGVLEGPTFAGRI